MFYVDLPRERLITMVPPGAVWCEVGVFKGEFSERIIADARAAELHLIDLWKWTYYDWNNPPPAELGNIAGFKTWMTQQYPEYDGGHPDRALEVFYRRLVDLAARETRCRLHVHRGASVEIAATLPDGHFDVAYIDADHHYDSVLNDLFAYESKVKPGGLIIGDDFLDDLTRRDAFLGTIEAVSTFTKRTAWRCLIITGFVCSQFVLYREVSPFVDQTLSNLLHSGAAMIEINDVLLPRFGHKLVKTKTAERYLPSFG